MFVDTLPREVLFHGKGRSSALLDLISGVMRGWKG